MYKLNLSSNHHSRSEVLLKKQKLFKSNSWHLFNLQLFNAIQQLFSVLQNFTVLSHKEYLND